MLQFRSLTATGWIQDQHGAWPMALLPVGIGSFISSTHETHALLFFAWLSGFHVFNVLTLWAKVRSHAKRRNALRPALIFWTALAAFSGAGLLFSIPSLLWWAPFFAPLIGIAVWESWKKNDRGILARVTTILASTLMLPVAASISEIYATASSSWLFVPLMSWADFLSLLSFPYTQAHGYDVWTMTILLCVYFLCTVPYVRSLIRGRRDRRWAQASVGAHLLVAGACTVGLLLSAPWSGVFLTLLWWVLAVRAGAIPIIQKRGIRIRPVHIGVGEFVATALMVAAILS